jgi:alpha-galactosidase
VNHPPPAAAATDVATTLATPIGDAAPGAARHAAARAFRRADLLKIAAVLGAGAACTPGKFDSPAPIAKPPPVDASAAPPTKGQIGFDAPVSLTSGTAFLRYDPNDRSWTLGNERFEEQLVLRPAPTGGYNLVRQSLISRDRAIQADVADVPDQPDATQDALGIAIDGTVPSLTPIDQRVETLPGGVLYAAARFHDWKSGAELTAEMRLRPGYAVVEHRSSVRDAAERRFRVTRLDAADLIVRSGASARWRAATLDNQGNIYFARLGRDGVLEAETPAQSAARAPVIPLLVLHDAAGDEGLFFGLRWTSNYRITVRSLGDRRVGVEAGVRMLADPQLDPSAAVSASQGFQAVAGQTIVGPWLLIGLFDGSMENATEVLKGYLTADRPREPTWAEDVMPVAWNSWFAYGTGVDYPSMLDEARRAAALGVEMFYVDYGWSASQGDWTPHPTRFPGLTLRQLADEVHKLGMRFGLWVAFGVADPDSQTLIRHPEFRAQQPTPARTGIDGSLPLCLYKAQAWVKADLARIVKDYRIDWLKFDQPMVAACLDPTHGHDPSVRGSLQANNQALYDILTDLRTRSPELFVESTFDGAGYLDYGLYARSHAAWLDDAAGDPSVPMQVVQQSFYGASLAFPARFLTLWLARGPVGDGVEGRGLSPEDLSYQGYSTMGGSWGLSLRLGDLDADQAQVVRDLIADYHAFREILPGARVYHLLPALAVAPTADRGPTVENWFALQYVQPDSGRGAVLVVRNAAGADQQTLKLRGLDPDTTYRVDWSDGRFVAEDDGSTLMSSGFPMARDPYSGGIVRITPLQ